MPCYIHPPVGMGYHEGLFWPGLIDGDLFGSITTCLPSAFRHGVEEEAILSIAATHPLRLAVYEANTPQDGVDGLYRTTSTRGIGHILGMGVVEVALRQDLSLQWQQICSKHNLVVPRCTIFHARYL